MARALVIGGTLFIGRALVEQLLARGDQVVIMHRGRATPFGDRVGEVRCDRNDVAAVRAALDGARYDVVYDNVYDWERGTSAEMVVAAARAAAAWGGLRRYVFTSSVAVYPEGAVEDEDATLVPADFPGRYNAQKAESERALFDLHRHEGIPVTTLRPAFIYGPHNAIDREGWFWDRIVAGRPVIVPDDGTRTMQFVHARDVARAAVLAVDSDRAAGRAYDLAGFPPVTQLAFIAALAKAADREVRAVHIPRAELERLGGQVLGHPQYFGTFLDIPPITVRGERVRAELGLQLTPFAEGLRETFAWYSRQRRPRPDFAWEDGVLRGR